MDFRIHTPNSAPDRSKEILAQAQAKYTFVPNLLGVMAEAPALLKAYTTLSGIFDETSFSTTEKQIVLLTVSHLNDCTYCMAAHSTIAAMQGVPSDVIQALRNDVPIDDIKLEALRTLTHEMAATRGYPSEGSVSAFKAAGYSERQLLEVVLGVGFKTLSNYTNHLAHTPLDDAFKPKQWRKESCESCQCHTA